MDLVGLTTKQQRSRVFGCIFVDPWGHIFDKHTYDHIIGFGDRDKSTPPDYLKAFRAALKKSKLKVEMDVFQDTEHGYCFAERSAYNPVAAEASWGKIFNLWERNLKH